MNLLKRLNKLGLLATLPKFLLDNTMYATYMGSAAYGVSNLSSDIDVYGFCLPPKESIFPHLAGEIPGFGRQIQRFDQWQQHHIQDKSAEKEYDITIFSIVKYFQLCMENNPNIVDSLFVPRTCIIHSTALSELVRENRKLFLHKGSYHKFKGYAYSQMHKMRIKEPEVGSKRYDMVQQYKYDLKFAYHVVRLLEECIQILVTHDIDLQKNNEQLKSIRRGEWTLEQVEQFFVDKERQLEDLYAKSTLQYKPDEDKIKELLMACLEMHYGSLEKAIYIAPDLEVDLKRIAEIANKYI
ncbi:nucleotidyltransferase domain-containing protein [bacterium]|nr:nucleotidyltransferase domain-containing protein [bacterium]